MTQAEVFAFNGTLKRVAAVFGKRTDNVDFHGLATSYFRALSRYELADLERGADAWISSHDKFPKPAEWAQAIPRREVLLDTMTDAEAREWHRAESLKWEDAPCPCIDCVSAGAFLHRRFVPEFTVADGLDRKVRDPLRNRIVTAGHWAHGVELQGYYRAKGEFYEKCTALGLKPTIGREPSGQRRRRKAMTLVTA